MVVLALRTRARRLGTTQRAALIVDNAMTAYADNDRPLRLTAFDTVRRLTEMRGDLTAGDLKAGFEFQDERIPLINPQRGIFKPRQMQFLLSIRTVFPRTGAKVWYDD